MKQRILAWLMVVALVLVALYGAGWLIWCAMLEIPANILRGWALGATALLPVVSWVSWWFGSTEARGRLAGLDVGIDRVMGAATRAAGLRVGTARAMQAPPSSTPVVMELPPPEVVYLPPSRGRIVEL